MAWGTRQWGKSAWGAHPDEVLPAVLKAIMPGATGGVTFLVRTEPVRRKPTT